MRELRLAGFTAAELRLDGAFTSEQITAGGYTPDTRDPTPCGAGQYWSIAAFSGVGGCFPCAPGSYHSGVQLLVGGPGYTCPQRCAQGETSLPGATSNLDCIPAFIAMGPIAGLAYTFHPAAAPHSCTGAHNVATDPTNKWNNQGFGYILSESECTLAADTLARAVSSPTGSGAVAPMGSLVNSLCTSNATTGTTRSGLATAQGGSPPRGVCGVLHTGPDVAGQPPILVYLREQELQCSQGMRFTAICRIVFCSHLEQVRGDGATPMAKPTVAMVRSGLPKHHDHNHSPGTSWRNGAETPTQDDAAVCEANPLQLSI